MWEPDKQHTFYINANGIFPNHIEITHKAYRIGLGRYFRELKRLDSSLRLSMFSESYYSENGITWAILDGVRYFTISINTGNLVEGQYYYGKQILTL